MALIAPGGPAEKAGLRGYRRVVRTYRRGPFLYEKEAWDRSKADEIIAIDGQRVETLEEFLTAIDRRKPGETAKLKVLREGREVTLDLVLGEDRR